MLVHNVKRAFEILNSLPGFSCQPVEGGAFAFPRLHLPPKAIQKAEVTILSHRTKYTLQNQSTNLLYFTPGCVFAYFRKWECNRIHSTVLDY